MLNNFQDLTFNPSFVKNQRSMLVHTYEGILIPCTALLYFQLHPFPPWECLSLMEVPESWLLKICGLGSTCKTKQQPGSEKPLYRHNMMEPKQRLPCKPVLPAVGISTPNVTLRCILKVGKQAWRETSCRPWQAAVCLSANDHSLSHTNLLLQSKHGTPFLSTPPRNPC